jgi:putative nucleotidyltransferase with HDIG domain
MDMVKEAEAHARATYPNSYWPHIVEVVRYARHLAEALGADREIVTLAAYFHDISRVEFGAEEHNVRSAKMARRWLEQLDYPVDRIERVAAAIVAHMRPAPESQRDTVPLEAQVVYDADKTGRAMGMGLLAVLVQLGGEVPWHELDYRRLADAVRKGREGTQQAYGSLYTEAAREMARSGYEHAIAFCDQVLAMPAFQTPGKA